MRFSIPSIAAAALLVPAANAQKHADKPIDPNKKVCRHYDTPGSILGSRLECHTVAEWHSIDEGHGNQAEALRQMPVNAPRP